MHTAGMRIRPKGDLKCNAFNPNHAVKEILTSRDQPKLLPVAVGFVHPPDRVLDFLLAPEPAVLERSQQHVEHEGAPQGDNQRHQRDHGPVPLVLLGVAVDRIVGLPPENRRATTRQQ